MQEARTRPHEAAADQPHPSLPVVRRVVGPTALCRRVIQKLPVGSA